MSRSDGSGVAVWRAVVLAGALGTAVGLIGRIPWLGLIAGPLSIVGVIGLSITQRSAARATTGTAGAPAPGSGRFDAPPARRPTPPWVWVGVAVVAVAAGVAALLMNPGEETERAAEPAAARVPLGFHLVQDVVPGACGTTPAASGPAAEYPTADGSGCVKVSAEGGFSVTQLARVQLQDLSDQGNGWVVQVTLAGEDAARFTDLTTRASTQPQPRNQVAIVVGTRLVSNPAILEPLTGGTAMIATRLTREDAQALAADLGVR